LDGQDWLADGFEAHRPRLRAVAYRMLGSADEADDAVQEAWLRLSRSDAGAVQNLGGWLTTVVGRICVDMLRTRTSRREEPLAELAETAASADDPEQEAMLVDSVGLALLVVLDALTPAERLAFVLHDIFAVPFDEIATILGRSQAAAKMLASRARRQVQVAETTPDGYDLDLQHAVVQAFLAASRDGDFDALINLLHPDVELRSDGAAVQAGAVAHLTGAARVAEQFCGRAHGARMALVGGSVGAVWAPRGKPRYAFIFTFADRKIVAIDLIGDRARLDQLDPTIL